MSRDFGLDSRHVRRALAATSDETTYRQLGITDREPETLREILNDACGGSPWVLALLAAGVLFVLAAARVIIWLGETAADHGWLG